MIQRYEHFSLCDEVEEELIALACVRLSISSSPIYWTARKFLTLSCSDFQEHLSYSFLLKTLLSISVPHTLLNNQASLVAWTVKNLPAMQETPDLVPWLRRSSGEGNGYPLQYSCLENSMHRGAWQATVHGVTKSWTQLSE